MKKIITCLWTVFTFFAGINIFSKELFGLNFIIKIYQVINISVMRDSVVQLIELLFNSMTIIVCIFGFFALFDLIIELIIQEIYETNC